MQADTALAAAIATAVTLKAQVVAAAEQLTELRSALAAAGSAAASLARQAGVREQQVGALAVEAAKARRECTALESQCVRLRAQRQQQGTQDKTGSPAVCTKTDAAGTACPLAGGGNENSVGSGLPTILEYMRIKNACSEAAKRIADWQRKLQVQAVRLGAARARSG